jgi:stage IV sporulation protein FB
MRFRVGLAMIRFRLFGFPIQIHWSFWLVCALLGGLSRIKTPDDLRSIALWLVACFISILIHELGHAFAMRHFGDREPQILLHSMGGLAQGTRYHTRSEDILITAAGPWLQISLGVAVMWLIKSVPLNAGVEIHFFLNQLKEISIFWALVNLLPVYPLDGGRILRSWLGPQQLPAAQWVSLVTAVGAAIYGFQHIGLFTALLFGSFAWQNWQEIQGGPTSRLPGL